MGSGSGMQRSKSFSPEVQAPTFEREMPAPGDVSSQEKKGRVSPMFSYQSSSPKPSERNEEHKGILEFCYVMPGVPALGAWMLFYFPLIATLNSQLGSCPARTSDDTITMPMEQFMQVTGLFIFLVCMCLDLASAAMQVSPKKRQLSSIILFINAVCAVVYATLVSGYVPKIVNMEGQDITLYCMHMLEWCFTTPAMIIIIDSLGTPMKAEVVSNWSIVGWLLFYDELMIMLGCVTLFIPHGPIMYLCNFGSTVCFLKVCLGIHSSVGRSIERSGTSFEEASIRYLEFSTFLLWSCFPILHMANVSGYLSAVNHSLGRVVTDVVAKTVYSVALLSGNFCLLDTVAELRLLQLKEASQAKEGKIVKVEKMNEALQMAVMEAETSARLSRRFVANVSHELRTPLNSVINFNSLLLDAGLEEVHQEYVASALTSAQALLGVINQVLDFSKLESSSESIHLEVEPFYLSALCEDVEDIVAARIAERGVDFMVRCPLKSPCIIGDRFRLRQCVINLADNAVKFAKKSGGEVSITVKVTADEEPSFVRISIAVEDNGNGIPQDKLGLLFQPFSQVDSNYSRQHGGTGLGLAITKKIIEAMEGTIQCSSQVGVGTTFQFDIRLPVASQEQAFPEPVHSNTKLNGDVVICMPPSLAAEMIKEHCLTYGLRVQDHSNYNDNVQSFVLDFIKKGSQEVIIVDYETHLQVLKSSPEIEFCKMLVVGKLSAQANAVARGQVDIQGFIPTPVKPSVLHSRLQDRLAGSGVAFQNGSLATDVPVGGPIGSDSPAPTESSTNRVPASQRPVSSRSTIPATASPTNSGSGANKIRVLLVEDQPVNQKVAIAMITKILGKNGVTFETAEHGIEGLDRATESRNFDLVLMDCQMPYMDGLECTQRIRQWEKEHGVEVPYYIIAMTAHASKEDLADCLKAGMNDYCSKPISMKVLKESLARFQSWLDEKKPARNPGTTDN